MTLHRVFSIGLLITAAIAGPVALSEEQKADDSLMQAINGEHCADGRCLAVVRGLIDFFDRRLHGQMGNGRACADCHMPSQSFQLSPTSVEARYQALQARRQGNPRADDPLFRPVDANDYRVNGDKATDYSNLREHALIRVTLPLPANVQLIDPATGQPSSERSVDVWRAVPTVNNVRMTGPDAVNPWPRGPDPSGGYQLDARFGTLQEQALGALLAHAEVQIAPPQRFLDDLSAFQRLLFSSRGMRELSEAIDAGVSPLPDPDPPLSEVEQAGKVVFTRACGQCHGGPAQSTPLAPAARYHDISTTCPRPIDPGPAPRFVFKPCPVSLAGNIRTYVFTQPDGSIVTRSSDDPGRALLTGFVLPPPAPPATDDWNKLDVPSLRGIGRTAPYFHNNSADTLEEVVDHYTAFFKRVLLNVPPGKPLPPAISTDGKNPDRPPTPDEIPTLLAYLRKL